MTKILWEFNQLAITQPIIIDPLEQLQESQEYEIQISHDSNKPIVNCGFYLSPFSGRYTGTDTPDKDYERVLWLANNYPGFGLSIRQEYEAFGTVDSYGTVRLLDLTRPEEVDIFSGQELEILGGSENGNKRIITAYDPLRKYFTLSGSFVNDVTSENYQILINEERFFKSKDGAAFSGAIPILYGGGTIARFEKIKVRLKMRIPKFAISAGSFMFDLNLRYTPVETGQE
jgi:hypothetical protein